MNILIIDGPYKGCEATTFTKGGIHYFKDEFQNSDILLSNHLYVLKDGYLNDIVYILNLARNSDNLNNFIELFEKDLNKMKFKALLLRKNRIEKLYSYYEEIENKLFELLKNNKDDEICFNIIIQYLSNIKGRKMRKEYRIKGEIFLYDKELDWCINSALEDIPTVVFTNKIQYYIQEKDLTITVFGEGDKEHGETYECKVKKGFDEIIFEAPIASIRNHGIIDCYDWILRNKLI